MTTATPVRPEVRIAERAGFCYGVRLAIDKAKHARSEGKEVTTLGQLVHNPGIKADLSDRGIRTADLADQVQDHACRDTGEPVWATPGSHPSFTLIREIAVWRAANGINPHDPRPTGGKRPCPNPPRSTGTRAATAARPTAAWKYGPLPKRVGPEYVTPRTPRVPC